MEFKSLLEWAIFLTLIVGLIYTLWIIKNEKAHYLAHAQTLRFASFSFLLPPWWTKTQESATKVEFERRDTRYDWKAIFELGEKEEKAAPEDILEAKLKEWEIVFDPQKIITHRPGVFYRMEGTATQAQCERVYLDIILFMASPQHGQPLFCASLSSVLNGCIEGPYFEEVMKGILSQGWGSYL